MNTKVIIKDSRSGFQRIVTISMAGDEVLDRIKNIFGSKIDDVSVLIEEESSVDDQAGQIIEDSKMVLGLLRNQTAMPFLEIAAMSSMEHERLKNAITYLQGNGRVKVKGDTIIEQIVTLVK